MEPWNHGQCQLVQLGRVEVRLDPDNYWCGISSTTLQQALAFRGRERWPSLVQHHTCLTAQQSTRSIIIGLPR